MKTFIVVFHNRVANQTQTWKTTALNEFRAGRQFYRKYNRKAYYDCIENIREVGIDTEELLKLIEELYVTGSKFDSALVHATSNNGESLLDGDEYKKLCDSLIKAEELLTEEKKKKDRMMKYLYWCNECAWEETMNEHKYDFCPQCGHVNISRNNNLPRKLFNQEEKINESI